MSSSLGTASAAATSKFPTSSAVRDRNRSATIQTMSLTRSLIPQEHRPILDQLLVRLSLRQGQRPKKAPTCRTSSRRKTGRSDRIQGEPAAADIVPAPASRGSRGGARRVRGSAARRIFPSAPACRRRTGSGQQMLMSYWREPRRYQADGVRAVTWGILRDHLAPTPSKRLRDAFRSAGRSR
jgi:hypothetical protein